LEPFPIIVWYILAYILLDHNMSLNCGLQYYTGILKKQKIEFRILKKAGKS